MLKRLSSRITELPGYAEVSGILTLVFIEANSVKVWPKPQHLKEFIAALYNCQPKSGKDIPLRFIPTDNPSLRSLEALWESRFRAYLNGVDTPLLARWIPPPEGVDMSKASGRAILLLKACTGISLMPMNSSGYITVSAHLGRLSLTVC
jgi:hypothetical protein